MLGAVSGSLQGNAVLAAGHHTELPHQRLEHLTWHASGLSDKIQRATQSLQ